MKCCACHGPYHPSTGHRFTDDAVLCGRCAKEFLAWYKARMGVMGARIRNHTTGLRDRESFAEVASRSIIGDSPEAQS